MTAPKERAALDDGVYFDLPEADYHAAPRLSCSGIKRILQSPLDFYVRSWFAGEDREPEESSDQMDLGKAYHKRIIEGREAFYRAYDVAFDPEQHPTALRTMDDLRIELKARGLKVAGNKAELVERLLEADPDIAIIDQLCAEWEGARRDKILLPAKSIRRIEIAAAMIEKHPDLRKAFTGGRPEVSVCWTDAESGVKMKARIDYLKPRATVDLKTFSNPYGRPIEQAIITAFAGQRYQIQAAVYDEAVKYAVQFLRSHKVEDDWAGWTERILATPERSFFFVFQAQGPAPVALGYQFPKGTMFDIGKMQMRKGIETFKHYAENYGTDPWIELKPVGVFDDLSFPNYAMEGV